MADNTNGSTRTAEATGLTEGAADKMYDGQQRQDHNQTQVREEMGASNTIRLAVVTLLVSVSTACSFFNAAPSECTAAAADAGLPDDVIEQLRNPDGLNAIERVALQRVLVQAGIDDVCKVWPETVPGASRADEQGGPTMDTRNPLRQTEDSSSATENNRGNAGARASASLSQDGARIPADEHRRRCSFWALNNLPPVVYSEFSKLNPDTMDDLDRILWRSQLNGSGSLGYYDDDPAAGEDGSLLLPRNPGIYCRDYWAEPLNRSNANLRNQGFEAECRFRLEDRIAGQYRRLRDGVHNDEGNVLVYNTPNQYVRILQWLDLSGEELLDAQEPPYSILHEESRRPYAHWQDRIPTEDGLDDYRRKYEETLNLGWLGIVSAAGLSARGSTDVQACHYYYPQLFYGYWVPFDPFPMPSASQYDEMELPRFEGATTPLYLPKSVTAEKIRVGYPLGKTTAQYHLCQDSSETEEVGYYYVDHPAGDYCELKP